MVTKGDIQDLQICDCIEAEELPIAAWEAFLLNSLWHVVLHFWHGCYNRRSYIFSDKDISTIKFISFISPEYRIELIQIISQL